MVIKREDISVDDIDYSEIDKKYSTDVDYSTEHILVLDQIPIFDETKEAKFISILKKAIFNPVGAVIAENGTFVPKDPETGQGKGYMFIEFGNEKQMRNALEASHGYQLDKKHKFVAFPFSEIDRLSKMEYSEFQYVPEFIPERPFSQEYLMDLNARDQFFTFHADTFSLYWNEKSQSDELIFSQRNVAEHFQWSPKGAFLATFHSQGILIWDIGRESLVKYRKIPHPNVAFSQFSPEENYMVTFSNNPVEGHPDGHNVFIWCLDTGRQLYSTQLLVDAEKRQQFWPLLSWSYDDKYVAFANQDSLYCYEVNPEKLTLAFGKQPLHLEGVQDVCWAPSKKHWLSFWCPESVNTPAKVSILEIPSQKIIRTKNLFNVATCRLYWQSNADYLAITVDRQKSKKVINSNIEFFRLNMKDIPIDVVEMKGTVVQFTWEPSGESFAVIENELTTIDASAAQAAANTSAPNLSPLSQEVVPTQSNRTFIRVYDMGKQLENGVFVVKCLDSIERKNINRLIWNPKGRFILLAGLESAAGHLEFWSVNDRTELECMFVGEHYMATGAEWDPSGRYLLTFQSYLRYQMESTYMLWDFRGQVLRRQPVDKLKYAAWRPRPKALLSAEQLKSIHKQLKEYSIRFDAEDARRSDLALQHGQASRLQLKEDWQIWRRASRQLWNVSAPNTISSNQEEVSQISEWMEELLEETEQVIE